MICPLHFNVIPNSSISFRTIIVSCQKVLVISVVLMSCLDVKGFFQTRLLCFVLFLTCFVFCVLLHCVFVLFLYFLFFCIVFSICFIFRSFWMFDVMVAFVVYFVWCFKIVLFLFGRLFCFFIFSLLFLWVFLNLFWNVWIVFSFFLIYHYY